MRKTIGVLALLMATSLSAAAEAQLLPDNRPVVVVNGRGKVETVPDVAVITFDLRGEGRTADDATRDMVEKRKRVQDGTAGLFGRQMRWTTGELRLGEVRGQQCQGNGYNPLRLSTDACSIIGHVASLRVTIRTSAKDRAGTAVGLIGRLGGAFVRLERWELSDSVAAQRAATAQAAANAREQAEALAVAGGGRLGPVLRVQDGYGEIVVASRVAQDVGSFPAAPPPPPPPPPIEVALTPQPIETSANVTMTFELLR